MFPCMSQHAPRSARARPGAQPPLELLRQALGQGGWYGRDAAFRALADVQFVAAMGPPGGGCTAVPDRLLRHFHCVALPQVRRGAWRRPACAAAAVHAVRVDGGACVPQVCRQVWVLCRGSPYPLHILPVI